MFIKDGRVFHELKRCGCSNEEMYQRITKAQTAVAVGGVLYE